MIILIIGLILFFGIHLSRELGFRDTGIARFGTGQFKLIYSAMALTGLIFIIWGKSRAPFVMLYEPAYEMRYISHLLMIPAFILVLAGNLPASYIRQQTLHPMLLGVAIWGAAHLWANGDLASVLLFGSFVLWSLFKVVSLIKTNKQQPAKPSVIWDIAAVVLGFTAYATVLIYHGQLFGIGLGLD